MTYQEILEGITRHRADVMRINEPSQTLIASEVQDKVEQIEWALQALAEKLRDDADIAVLHAQELKGKEQGK